MNIQVILRLTGVHNTSPGRNRYGLPLQELTATLRINRPDAIPHLNPASALHFSIMAQTPRVAMKALSSLARTQSSAQRVRISITPVSRSSVQSHIRSQTLRAFSTTPIPRHGHLTPPPPGQERHVTFIDKDQSAHTFVVSDGDNLLDIAQANDLEMEGACGGSCACSTCHVIVCDNPGEGMEANTGEWYEKIEEPSDDENDMLDLAFGLTETSRLGCQVVMSKELDGLVVKLPSMTRNLQASDFAEKK